MPADYDSPWKEALAHYFRALVELCFPRIAAAIDWAKGFEFLDTELHELLRGAVEGRQHVDKLVRVTLLDGQIQRILVHIEVQHRPDSNFPERLYSYHVRLREKGEPVVSVAILADIDPRWRPSRYEHELLGCRVVFDFPTCKLLDLLQNQGELERSHSPSAVFVLANWAAQHTRHWLIELPPPLEKQFRTELIQIDQEQQHMPYVTSIERLAREEGREEAMREMIVEYLRSRFSAVPQDTIEALQNLDLPTLKSVQRQAWNSNTIEEINQFLASLRKQ